MFDSDRFLTLSVLVKWLDGEALSVQDLERAVKFLETKRLNVNQVDPGTLTGLQMRLRDALRPYLEPPK